MLANANTVATIIASLLGLALTAVGIYYTNNQRRQLDIHVADQRIKAYSELWALMKIAAPMRTPEGGSLSAEERLTLFDQLTDWYYADGNGMLLELVTREMYLVAKNNLVRGDGQLQPPSLSRPGLTDLDRAQLSISQLSLLRSQMKADVGGYGLLYEPKLSNDDRAFLLYCGADLRRPPWSWPWYYIRRPRSRRVDVVNVR